MYIYVYRENARWHTTWTSLNHLIPALLHWSKMEGPTAIVLLVIALLQSVLSQSCSREEYNSMQLDFTSCTGSVEVRLKGAAT